MADSISVASAGFLKHELPDPRSFHVFEREQRFFLFDRHTSNTFEVSGEIYAFFSLIESRLPNEDFERALEWQFGANISALDDVLASLYSLGCFKFAENDRSVQKEILNQLWDHKPRRVQLLMAQGCNLGCRYCYAWRNGSNQKNTLMPWEIARASVDNLVQRSGHRRNLQITFFGGEPLLNYPTIKKVVAYCKLLEKKTKKKFVWELITNGTLLTEDKVRFLVKHRFLLFISLDGWKEMHNWNRPSIDGNDWHDEIVRNAMHANEEYKKNGLAPVKVRANLTSKFHDHRRVVDYLRSLGFENIGMSAIEPLPHQDHSPSSLTEDQMDQLQNNYFTDALNIADSARKEGVKNKLDYQLLAEMARPLEKSVLKGITCGVGRNTATVDNKGNIVPCHRYEGMEQYILGDVWNGMDRDKTMGYYNKVNDNALNRCHSCWIRDYCRGGCAWLLSAKDGSIHDPTLRECDRRRRGIEDKLFLRLKIRQELKPLYDAVNSVG